LEKHKYFDENSMAVIDAIANSIAIGMKPADPETKIIVTIPAHNEEKVIVTCLESLFNQYSVFNQNLVARLKATLVPDEWGFAPNHPDNSGPNLAVRADVYEAVGGMRPLGFCEDIAFYDSIIYGGFKVRHCPETIVTTSSRQDPRAPWGFGAELKTWNDESSIIFEVEGLKALLERLKIYNLVKALYLTKTQKFLERALKAVWIKIN
jgi:glycosyltransferase involved in cell wall biosynthesis